VPARAQFALPGLDLHKDERVAPEVQEKRDQVDRAYRDTKGTLPSQQSASDPWANMRGADEARPAVKPAAKPKPATASNQKKQPTPQ
jgi:hypothetical protein